MQRLAALLFFFLVGLLALIAEAGMVGLPLPFLGFPN